MTSQRDQENESAPSSRSDAGGGRAELAQRWRAWALRLLDDARADRERSSVGLAMRKEQQARTLEACAADLLSSPPVGEGVREAPAEPQACETRRFFAEIARLEAVACAERLAAAVERGDSKTADMLDAQVVVASRIQAAIERAQLPMQEPQACGWQDDMRELQNFVRYATIEGVWADQIRREQLARLDRLTAMLPSSPVAFAPADTEQE